MLPSPPFAILDFPGSAPRLFASPREIFTAEKVERVGQVLDRVEAASRAGLQAVGFVAYEAAPAFDSALTARGPAPLHYAWFAAFDESLRLDESLLPRPQPAIEWTPDVTREEYDAAIAELRKAIGQGDYYQVNHTLRPTQTLPQRERIDTARSGEITVTSRMTSPSPDGVRDAQLTSNPSAPQTTNCHGSLALSAPCFSRMIHGFTN